MFKYFCLYLSLYLLVPASAWAISGDDFLALCAENSPGSDQAIRQAIEEGAEVNYSGPGGLRPLMIFVGSRDDRDLEAVSTLKALLAAGADLNARSEDGATALSFAVVHRAGPRLISVLLRNGADPNLGVSSRGGLTPLMIAAGVESDPLVSALLLAAGARTDLTAEREGQRVALVDLAARNPNPTVRNLIEAAVSLGGAREEGLPFFIAAPAEADLRLRIKNLDQHIRRQIGLDDWQAWLDYIKWQIGLDASIDLRRSALGNSLSEAWLNEYVRYLEALEDKGARSLLAVASAAETRLVFQSFWETAEFGPAASVAGRRVIILSKAEQGTVVAYARDGGAELWRYTPSVLSGFYLLKSPSGREYLFLASHWGEGFGDAVLLDAESGEALWSLPALDDPRWALSPDRGTVAVSTDYSLHLFNLDSRRSQAGSWFELLESLSWPEARARARTGQNELLSPLGLSLDEEGRFSHGGRRLFQGGPQADPLMLEQSRQALAAHNYQKLEVLAIDGDSAGEHNFVLGISCGSGCSEDDASAPLFLVNKKDNLIDGLPVGGRMLSSGDLAWRKGFGGGLVPQLAFSPEGDYLALMTGGGELHFFSTSKGGEHLGFLPARTLIDPASGAGLEGFHFLTLLDDEAETRLCAFISSAQDGPQPLIAEINPFDQSVRSAFRIPNGRLKKLKAFAADGDRQWAAALADGGLWLIYPRSGLMEKVAGSPALDWTALAFSGNGRRLAAAESGGGLYIYESGGDAPSGAMRRRSRGDSPDPLTRQTLKLKNIRHLALDQEGQAAWAAADEYDSERGASGPAVALADLSGRTAPLYRAVAGRIVDLRFDARANYALAVEDAPPTSEGPGGGPMKAARWAQGRLDLISFDHSSKDGQAWFYDPQKDFVGLSPDLSSLLFQRLHPSQAFVNLGREMINSRESFDLEAFGSPARLGRAVFSPDGRLALLPEAGLGPGPERSPFNVGGAFFLYDLSGGREVASMNERWRHPEGIAAAALFNGGASAVTAGWDGSIRLWDLSRARPYNLLTWGLLEDDNWLVSDPEGRFDATAPQALQGAHWLVKNRLLEMPALIDDFFQPRLSAYILNGVQLPRQNPLDSRSLFQPQVKIVGIEPQKNKAGRMSVTVEVGAVNDGRPDIPSRIRLYCNGRLVGIRPEAGGALSSSGGLVRQVFDGVILPVGRSRAFFRAEAVNSDGLVSRPALASIKYKFKGEARPRLYVTAVGVDDYANPAWNISGAGDNARFVASTAGHLFRGENEIRLLAEGSAKPLKDEIRKAVEALSQAGPDDVALLYLAGRGVTVNGRFHLLPADVGGQGRDVTAELLKEAISSADLAQWLKDIKAGEAYLIVDSFSSEAAKGQFEPGPAGDRSLALLARDRGLRLLCLESGEGRPGEGAVYNRLRAADASEGFSAWLEALIKEAGGHALIGDF